MKATITVEDTPGGVSASSTIEDAQLGDLFAAFREVVNDFRSVSREPRWQVRVEVEDA